MCFFYINILECILAKSSNCWEKHQNYLNSVEPNSISNMILLTKFILIFSYFSFWVTSYFFFPQVKKIFSVFIFTLSKMQIYWTPWTTMVWPLTLVPMIQMILGPKYCSWSTSTALDDMDQVFSHYKAVQNIYIYFDFQKQVGTTVIFEIKYNY